MIGPISFQSLWHLLRGWGTGIAPSPAARWAVEQRVGHHVTPTSLATQAIAIAPDDPLARHLLAHPAVVRTRTLRMASEMLERLRAAGVELIIPLVTQGEIAGILTLGARRDRQAHSLDDLRLLNNLAAQAAPAVRIAQLVRAQQIELRTRERMEQELSVARLIQRTLLPKELPALPGWHLAAYYKPARVVGGDFYDVIPLARGRVGLAIGDVSGKGVPAALVMATTRSILRAAAQDGAAPGAVLRRVNELLCPDMPSKMFVTCLYAILDPACGRLRFANAGHDLPYHRHAHGADPLDARGMPLGLMGEMSYEEAETEMALGDRLLLYSDGLVEAHDRGYTMFGDPRLRTLVGEYGNGETSGAHQTLIDFLLGHLATFVGPAWEQEDDITLVSVQRSPGEAPSTSVVTARASRATAAATVWQ